jgi:predicted metal-dependent HD superfamily phosphohydrolase
MANEDRVVGEIADRTTSSRNTQFDATCYPSLKTDLKVFWDEAVVCFAVDGENTTHVICDDWYYRIYHQHNQSGRYYHTAVHLKEMLEYTKLIQQSGIVCNSLWYATIILATFFHDVVYDPKSNSNEKDSAELFHDFCQQISMAPSVAHVVETWILATQQHKPIPIGDTAIISKEQEHQLSLQRMFLDIDMAVLGKESEAYLVYAALIRKEYCFVPSDVYCSKRIEILDQFLAGSTPIYLSTIFQRALENRARNNLQHEIHLLKRGLIPGESTIAISISSTIESITGCLFENSVGY